MKRAIPVRNALIPEVDRVASAGVSPLIVNQMNLPEPQSVTFPSLFDQIRNGTIKIPQFQRDFVWTKAQSARLLDSIIKGYPIGTFIFWGTQERLRSIRNLGGIELPDTPAGNAVRYVLDGQQRMTSLFVTLNGLSVHREDHEDDYSQMWLDLAATEEDDLVLLDIKDREESSIIRLHDLLHGEFDYLASFPKAAQQRIKLYKNRIESYQFSAVQITDAPIDVATEIFTRLNVGGKPLTPFEIMVAKTYDPAAGFDLSEKFGALIEELAEIEYETIAESNLLQAIAIFLGKDAKRKSILRLKREDVIATWPLVVDGVKRAIDYFRSAYGIPASRLLPYPALVIPFAYFLHHHKKNPSGNRAKYLEDFFWRVSLSGRYSSGLEGRVVQDIAKIDAILEDRKPTYEWAVDVSATFIQDNGYFSTGRSFIKAMLCLMARKGPRSFDTNVPVQLDNDWLKQANSKNYHHFFPKSVLKKWGVEDRWANHIANITLVDDYLNKRVIGTQAPATYIKKFAKENEHLERTLATHLIGKPDQTGIMANDYDTFFAKRCQKISRELQKLILPSEVDDRLRPDAAVDTASGDDAWGEEG